jgi:uncharacterized protein (TIGR03437 family)
VARAIVAASSSAQPHRPPSRLKPSREVTFDLLQKKRRFLPLFTVAVVAASVAASAQTVRFDTSLGGIDVVLTPDVTPNTVANFMTYLNAGLYNNTIIHRVVPAFVVQGGGYSVSKAHLPVLIPLNPPIAGEFKTSNTRGTIAMALQNDPNTGLANPDSAQDEWFFNQADNSSTLDSQGFTVFGNIANDASLFVLDTIAGLPTFTFDGLSNFPLLNYTSGRTVTDSNYLYVNSIAPITPVDTAPGVVNAATSVSNTTTGISPGEFITIYGAELGPTALTGLSLDSSGLIGNTLQGTQVLFNGIPGPMIFTWTGQIAAVAPYGIANAATVDVVVSYLGIQTAPLQFKVVPANPGLFTLNSSGKGDAAIVRPDGSVVSASSPAAVGDTLELYGQGYGAVSNGLGDGALVTTAFTVPNTTLLIDGQKVNTLYAGGAGDEINGMFQINFVVPQLTPGSHQIQVQVGSAISPSGVTLQTM